MRYLWLLLFVTSAQAQLYSPAPMGVPSQEILQKEAVAPQETAKPIVKKPVAKKKTTPPEVSLTLPTHHTPTFNPRSRENLVAAVAKYEKLAKRDLPPLSGKNKAEIDERLALLGDASLKEFQQRHALAPTGVINPATLKAMNVPMRERLHALEKSLSRLEESRFAFGERYIVVNIPDAVVETVEKGLVTRRYIAIVGKPDRASPMVETRVTNVNFNPTWTVPTSIIKKDLIPKMQKDPQALAKMKLRILDRKGQEVNPATIDWNTENAVNYTLRQDAGASNSLGQMRIDMPNTDAVYMHDTPSKKLFRANQRFHSSGCVRVQNVSQLANWLLEPQGFGETNIKDALKTTARKDVRLKTPVPVAWVYLTGFVSEEGKVQFRNDIYDMDKLEVVQKIIRAPQRKPTVVEEETAPPPAPPQVEEKPFWSIFKI